jgi:hypothetical protein
VTAAPPFSPPVQSKSERGSPDDLMRCRTGLLGNAEWDHQKLGPSNEKTILRNSRLEGDRSGLATFAAGPLKLAAHGCGFESTECGETLS